MTRRDFTPRTYQHAMIDHILDTPRGAVWAGMGMGKSVATLTAIDILELVEPGPTLVLAPLRVAASTWPDEAAKWSHLRNIEVSAVVGNPEERRIALSRPASVYTINYENLTWLVDEVGDRWPFRKVVADESTKLKSFRLQQGGKRAHALSRVAHSKVSRFIELTGTPSPNGLQDLWGQAWFLDKGVRLGRSFGAYKSRWFQSIQVGADRNAVRLDPLPFAQKQIEDRLRDLCLSLDPRDYFDIAEPIVHTIRVELPTKARRLYRDMEREMFLALDNGVAVEAFNAASKTIKCLQLANGAIYTDGTGETWTEVHDAKLQALDDVIEEAAGMPVLVAYHFKSDIARLLKAFPKGRYLDQDPQTIRDWNAGKIPVLFAHPASAGHGLNLQDGGNILVFFGHWWDLEQYQQIIERIGPTRQMQAGYNRPVFIYHIIAADTVDESVMARRESKRAIQDLLLEAMKRRGPG
ncbi:DEAD/DEAH box helicase [Haematospirillum jordaniae]|uniref:DEAD/DEAH box helicase n=1 Tax=Haematospirillum TaxID=1804663 RepID=UPI001432F287|nr:MULTISPECIES: DEAD/DEAH box helicase [Haematospirillum]NKD46260.1 DEAD/DEAH box helicase [Haematospirillum jordaniae]NKD56051.1 DEAD/DEAH box helicase [Haematospirillum sp. H4890]NKD76113.1 DEAD/DEAH box helicase [Haematospirillum sp. H4485]NKD82344.1 DEAD/DEAH box helicase [Haematospirillum jordaniae]NKD93115.1 DEAD/DEAH box helicase [Haematospirillum jordaniae]